MATPLVAATIVTSWSCLVENVKKKVTQPVVKNARKMLNRIPGKSVNAQEIEPVFQFMMSTTQSHNLLFLSIGY